MPNSAKTLVLIDGHASIVKKHPNAKLLIIGDGPDMEHFRKLVSKHKLDDKVLISKNASSMGGSQIFLETNEMMSVEDLVKGICIASGNDATVALAEKIGIPQENIILKEIYYKIICNIILLGGSGYLIYTASLLNNIDNVPINNIDDIIKKYAIMFVLHPFIDGNKRALNIWMNYMLKHYDEKPIKWSAFNNDDYELIKYCCINDYNALKQMILNNQA